jgi:hypothetical protein
LIVPPITRGIALQVVVELVAGVIVIVAIRLVHQLDAASV